MGAPRMRASDFAQLVVILLCTETISVLKGCECLPRSGGASLEGQTAPVGLVGREGYEA